MIYFHDLFEPFSKKVVKENGYRMKQIKNQIKQYMQSAKQILLILIALVYIYPLVITFTNSLMGMDEIASHYSTQGNIFHEGRKYIEMKLIPDIVSLTQYKQILVESPLYLNMFWNSVKITVPVVLGQLLVSSMAAYAFTVLEFKGKEIMFFVYIIVMLLPLQVTLVPNFIVAEMLNMRGNYLSIILPGIFNPFGVFLTRQYMKMLPSSYREAAEMDGAGHIQIFISIILPMVKSALACVAILTFIDYWNLVEQAIIFLDDNKMQPLSTFLARINQGQMGVSFAASCFYVSPVLIILYYGQDYLKEGIHLSGLKG